MGLLVQLTPQLYALVKRNRRVRDAVLPFWRWSNRAVIGVRRFVTRQEVLPPPKGVCESTAQWVAAANACEPAAGHSFQLIHPSVEVRRTPPRTIETEMHWKFRVNTTRTLIPGFVAVVEGGRAYGEGTIITPDDQLLADVSRATILGQFATTDQHPIFAQAMLPPLRKVNGTVAALTAMYGRGYYHWMFDVLPRLQLLADAGFPVGTVDKYLVNSYVSRFHIETLNLLGIPRERVLESYWNPHLRAERLIVPSRIGDTGHPPAYACAFLRQTFLGAAPARTDGPKRLYINRSKVTHRKVTNEAAVIELLGRRGFESITLEDMPLLEQVSLMSRADVVVGPHGAGLTNIVFCKPGAKVIEFLSPRAVNVMYWTLCNQLGLDYHYILAEGPRPPEPVDPYLNDEDITINLRDLAAILDVAETR